MHLPRRQIERPGIQQQKRPPPRRNRRELGKADIVADSKPNLAIRRDIDNRNLIPRRQNLRLPKRDFARNIYIKQMQFPMRRQQVPRRREQQRRVMVFLRRRRVLWDRAAEEVGVGFAREGGECVEGGGLGGRWRVREQGFGILGEVGRAVGGVEAFGEDDQLGAGVGGFEDAGTGAGEVGGFVGAWRGEGGEL